MSRTTKSLVRALVMTVLGWSAGSAGVAGQAIDLPVDDGGWEISGNGAVGLEDGRKTFELFTAEVERKDLMFANGTLEFDMKVSGQRTFVGVKFHTDEHGNGEDIYFRPHKSGLPDAVQYDPEYEGAGGWQLYHGADATAFAWYEPEAWQHVRIEVRGTQAAVFLGDESDPVLVASHLRSGNRAGTLTFWALQPWAQKGDPRTVALANVRLDPGVTTYPFSTPPAEEPVEGVVRRWEVAGSRAGEAADLDALPADLDGAAWTPVEAEASGLVNLDRALPRPEARSALTFARLRIRADEARTVRLDLGYSDNATVFLDGRPLFTGRFSFSPNFPRRDGLITLDQATAHLSLSPGEHEVVVAVSDVFGGWGIMGRILDRKGIRILGQ